MTTRQKLKEFNKIRHKKVNLLLRVKKTTRKAISNHVANKTLVIIEAEKIMEAKENNSNSSSTSLKIKMVQNKSTKYEKSL